MKSRTLDQFYTKPSLAKKFYDITFRLKDKLSLDFDRWLEPSAGEGSFYNLLPENRLGVDLDPKIEGLVKNDFLTLDFNNERFITIGNPPFGKNSSLAIKFINKAAKNSVLIAFILPRTFKKSSIVKKINPNLHLIYEEILPKNSFTHNNEDYDVPCVFQVWQKKEEIRVDLPLQVTHKDFAFTTKDKANFAIQRVGNAAGRVKESFSHVAPSSHYFILANNKTKDIFKSINWNEVKHNTAGNPSISKTELIELFNRQKESS